MLQPDICCMSMIDITDLTCYVNPNISFTSVWFQGLDLCYKYENNLKQYMLLPTSDSFSLIASQIDNLNQAPTQKSHIHTPCMREPWYT